jgi:hypothetical protein
VAVSLEVNEGLLLRSQFRQSHWFVSELVLDGDARFLTRRGKILNRSF